MKLITLIITALTLTACGAPSQPSQPSKNAKPVYVTCDGNPGVPGYYDHPYFFFQEQGQHFRINIHWISNANCLLIDVIEDTQ